MTRLAALVTGFATLGIFGVTTSAQAQNWIQEEEVECAKKGAAGAVVGGAAGTVVPGAGTTTGAAMGAANQGGGCMIDQNEEEIINGAKKPDQVADDVVGGTQDAVEDGKEFIDQHNPF